VDSALSQQDRIIRTQRLSTRLDIPVPAWLDFEIAREVKQSSTRV
jgi:hypothetical protein